MSWFYKLRRRYRNLIAGVLWVLMFIVAGVVGGIYTADNIPTWSAVIVFILLVAAVVFTVFAVIATRREVSEKQKTNKTVTPPPSYFLQTTDDKLNERLQELDDLINVKQVECDALAPTDKHKKAALEYLLNLTNAKRELLKRKMALYEQSHGMPASADVSTQILNFPIHTKVVGVTFDDHQQNISQSKAGDALTIKHEPFEQFTESTSVYNARTGKLLGRINKELAHELVSKFGNGFTLNGEITQITGGTNDRPTFGCNIEIQL